MAARKGERHHRAKLTADDVRAMRARRTAGETIESIWLDYTTVDLSTVSNVVRRVTWRHLP